MGQLALCAALPLGRVWPTGWAVCAMLCFAMLSVLLLCFSVRLFLRCYLVLFNSNPCDPCLATWPSAARSPTPLRVPAHYPPAQYPYLPACLPARSPARPSPRLQMAVAFFGGAASLIVLGFLGYQLHLICSGGCGAEPAGPSRGALVRATAGVFHPPSLARAGQLVRMTPAQGRHRHGPVDQHCLRVSR